MASLMQGAGHETHAPAIDAVGKSHGLEQA
jgi:hypothetical protein